MHTHITNFRAGELQWKSWAPADQADPTSLEATEPYLISFLFPPVCQSESVKNQSSVRSTVSILADFRGRWRRPVFSSSSLPRLILATASVLTFVSRSSNASRVWISSQHEAPEWSTKQLTRKLRISSCFVASAERDLQGSFFVAESSEISRGGEGLREIHPSIRKVSSHHELEVETFALAAPTPGSIKDVILDRTALWTRYTFVYVFMCWRSFCRSCTLDIGQAGLNQPQVLLSDRWSSHLTVLVTPFPFTNFSLTSFTVLITLIDGGMGVGRRFRVTRWTEIRSWPSFSASSVERRDFEVSSVQGMSFMLNAEDTYRTYCQFSKAKISFNPLLCCYTEFRGAREDEGFRAPSEKTFFNFCKTGGEI